MHIVVWADLGSTGIQVRPPGRRLKQQELGIPDELWRQIQDWVKDYDPIIDMEPPERIKNLDIIRELDKRGLELTKLIKESIGESKPIFYESEGLLTYMKTIDEFDALAKEFEAKYCKGN